MITRVIVLDNNRECVWKGGPLPRNVQAEYCHAGDSDELHNTTGPAERRWDRGALVYEAWYFHGKLHRAGAPALREWVAGKLTREEWSIRGRPHRAGGAPAVFRMDEDGIAHEWWIMGERHRDGGPAVISRGGHEPMDYSCWYSRGRIHRVDGPAIIRKQVFDGEAQISTEWQIDGKRHREDGPAVVYEDADVRVEHWYKRGKKHNLNGPAELSTTRTGCIANYWLDGVCVDWAVWLAAHEAAIRALGIEQLLPQPIAEEIIPHIIVG